MRKPSGGNGDGLRTARSKDGGNGKDELGMFASLAEARSEALELVDSLGAMLSEVQEEKGSLMRRVADLTKEAANRDKVEKQLKARIKELEREAARCVDLQEKIAYQQKELAAATDKIARLESRCDQFAAAKRELESEVARLDDELRAATLLVKQLRSDLARLEREKDTANEKIGSLELDLSASLNKRRDLEARLKNSRAENEQLKLELRLARQALGEIHDALASTRRRSASAERTTADGDVEGTAHPGEAAAEAETKVAEPAVAE